MLGVPTDDVLAYNEDEVLSEEGLHAGVLRVVISDPSQQRLY